MMNGETVEGILGIVLFILVVFIIPVLLVILAITFTGGLAGFLSGVVGTRLFSRLPHVSSFFDRLTEISTGTQTEGQMKQRRRVVGSVLLLYGVGLALLYVPIVGTLESIGFSLFTPLPDGYLAMVALLYPFYMQIFVLPFFLLIHYLVTQQLSNSSFRVIAEWTAFLSIVNITIVLSLLITFQLLQFLIQFIF